ncbi:GldL-related protein [Flexithrix dorotheae]|uniref:GldL-related protein n=1 Tax=Flexithrix dorotheae TaxID=70993 RepID=UPI0003680189|nr:hypothetical protein [Flexithrix dorotheae]
MGNLTLENIEYLNQHLIKKEIKYDPLKGEMLDHVCCEIEELMDEGMSFPEAFMEFSKTVSTSNIKEIENETIHLVNYKLFIMRKAMYILGALSASIFLINFLFHVMHWPGASELGNIFWPFFIGFYLISLVYNYKRQKMNIKKKLAFALAALFSSSLIIGAFFKLQHLPGGAYFLIVGFIGGALVAVPYFFYSLYQKES